MFALRGFAEDSGGQFRLDEYIAAPMYDVSQISEESGTT